MKSDGFPPSVEPADSGDYASGASGVHEQIIGSFCHDLRQPLNAALMRLASLKRAYTSGQDRELLEELHVSLREIANMSETVFDAIRLSRASIRPNLGAVSITALLDRVKTEFAPLAEQKKLRFLICPAPYLVVTDEQLLSRILFNLVQNAISYTSEGGVLIAARRVSGQLSLEVWDTGPGIRDEQIEKIFTPFYRGGTAAEEAAWTKNTGIGLSNGREFARLLGGTLTVSSRYGRGSVFRLRLPLPLEALRSVDQTSSRGASAGRALVALVAADQEVLVEEQRVVLARGDAHVSFCDPLALLGYLNTPLNRPDALLIDLHMAPVGVEFLLGILSVRYPELRLAVIASDVNDPEAQAVARLGVTILPKPLTGASLDAFFRGVQDDAVRRPTPDILVQKDCVMGLEATEPELARVTRQKVSTELHRSA